MSALSGRKHVAFVVVALSLGIGIGFYLGCHPVISMPQFKLLQDFGVPAVAPVPKDDVNVFRDSQNHQSCEFHPSVQIPRKGSIKMCIYDPKLDAEISGFVSRTGRLYSESDISVMLDMMQEDTVQRKRNTTEMPSISLVDIGCNIGLFTLSAAVHGYRVLSVDAMNSSLQLLATSLRLANLTSQVTLVHNAISDSHRDVVVQVRLAHNIGASWVLQTSFDKNNNTGLVNTQTTVKAICLDDLVPHVPTRRIFLKMDIEGSEWLALKCADRFFTELDVPYFHMEWVFFDSSACQREKGAGIISYLKGRGYRPFHPNSRKSELSLEKFGGNILWIKK